MTKVRLDSKIAAASFRYVDVHCHLTDQRWSESSTGLSSYVEAARNLGIELFAQGGIGPQEWAMQLELQQKFSSKMTLATCFGLHPYWVVANSTEACEGAMDQLAQMMSKADLLGEMGLDFRSEVNQIALTSEIKNKQIHFFEEQLELAALARKPVVLHIVRAHTEAIQVLELFKSSETKGFIHSFNADWMTAKSYLDQGLVISVGGPLLRKNNHHLHEAVSKLPLEQILIETDAPDQAPPRYQGQLNPLSSLLDVAARVGELKNKSLEEVLTQSAINFKNLFN